MEDIWNQYNTLLEEKKKDSGNKIVDKSKCLNCDQQLCSDYTNGVFVCLNCGVINEESIFDEQAEWIYNSSDNNGKKDPSRCGAPINQMLEKSSMSTMIGGGNASNFMKKLHFQMSMDYVERARYHVFEKIQKMAFEKGNLSQNIIEQSKYYYMTLSKRKLSRGIIRQGLIACCILYACKYYNVSRSIKEISEMCEVTVPILNKTSKLFLEIMNDVLSGNYNNDDTSTRSTSYKDLIPRFIGKLTLENNIEKKLIKKVKVYDIFIKNCSELECKTPSSIAAGVILYGCNELNVSLSKNLISERLSVSIVTINKIHKILQDTIKND